MPDEGAPARPRLFNSLGARLTLAMTGLVLAVVAGLTTASVLRTEQIERRQLEESAVLLANAIAVTSMDTLYRGDTDLLGDALETLALNDVVVRGRFFDDSGRVIADTSDALARFVLEPDADGLALLASAGTPAPKWGDEEVWWRSLSTSDGDGSAAWS